MKKKLRFPLSYKRVFYYHPESQYFTFIHPDDFLRLAARRLFKKPTGEAFVKYDRRSVEHLKKRILAGKEIDPLFLDINPTTCGVVSHEGRHRAVAAKELGVDKLPLILFCTGPKGYHYQPSKACKHCLRDWRKRLVSEDVQRARDVIASLEEK